MGVWRLVVGKGKYSQLSKLYSPLFSIPSCQISFMIFVIRFSSRLFLSKDMTSFDISRIGT